jgi:hypothetical protein
MAGKSKTQKPVKGSAPRDCGGIKLEKFLTPEDVEKFLTPKDVEKSKTPKKK